LHSATGFQDMRLNPPPIQARPGETKSRPPSDGTDFSRNTIEMYPRVPQVSIRAITSRGIMKNICDFITYVTSHSTAPTIENEFASLLLLRFHLRRQALHELISPRTRVRCPGGAEPLRTHLKHTHYRESLQVPLRDRTDDGLPCALR